MPRIHLFELEDQPWFPGTVRDLATDYLHFIETRFALHRPAVSLVAQALQESGQNHIVDLCSGGAGPIPQLLKELANQGITARVTLTDRFPNLSAFQTAALEFEGRIFFRTEPVDARAVPSDLRGLRTMFNSFHHFAPDQAILVLRDAARAGQPIGIFEIPQRSLKTVLSMLFLAPLMVLIATLFMRPFRWDRLLWTYVLPLVPLTCWWDGLVSQLRAYSPEELLSLADQVGIENCAWHAGRVRLESIHANLTYLVGSPQGIALNSAEAMGERLRLSIREPQLPRV